MVSLLSARVLLVLSLAGHACAGGPDRTAALGRWADYYARGVSFAPLSRILPLQQGKKRQRLLSK
jgi:hypothetical protein